MLFSQQKIKISIVYKLKDLDCQKVIIRWYKRYNNQKLTKIYITYIN